jgi:integrase
MKDMKQRQRSSCGNIQKTGRNSYQVRIFLGKDATGRRVYSSKSIRGTRKEAEKFLQARMHEKETGRLCLPTAQTLNEHLDHWLERIVKFSVRKVTKEGYEAKLDAYVRKGIGVRRLVDIKPLHIQNLYGEMLERGLSPKTVRHLHNILSPAFQNAVKWNVLQRNPCEVIQLPKNTKKEMACFSPEEATRFLEYAKADRYYATFALAIETGMRPEEYLGLKWGDIDFGALRLSVRRAVVFTKGGGFEFTETKTPQSRRNIPISKEVASILKDHRRNQLERKLRLGEVFIDLDLVFPSEIGTPTQTGNLNRRHFKKILKNAGLKEIRLYDLRHTMATLLLLRGINPKVVSERLGHSSISLTLDTYSHVLPSMQLDATSQLEEVLFRQVK